MPLNNPNEGVHIPFTSSAESLIAESNKTIAQLERVKDAVKHKGDMLVKQAQQEEQALKKSTMSWTDFRSMYSTVLDVVRVGQAVWEETGGKFVDNAIAVGDMARQIGTTTEEASRLKEISDDLGVGMDTLKTSFRAAQKDGISPTVEGLAKLSDEYLQLQPGVERTQFLLDKFGKSGTDMAIVMEKGGDAIRSMSAAVDDNLIVTQEAYEQARQFKASQDALNDSWDAFTYKVAPPLVDALTGLIDMQRDGIRAGELAAEQGKNWLMLNVDQRNALMELAAAERETADAATLAAETATGAGEAFEDEAERTKRLAEETRAAEEAIRSMTKANQEQLDLIGTLSDSNERYIEEQDKIQQELNEGKITLDEANAKWTALADAQEEAGRRMILNMLEQQLAVDGLDARETEYLLSKGLEWGVYSESAVAAAKAAQAEVAELTALLNATPSEKTVSIFLDMYQRAMGSAGNYGFNNNTTHQAGGTFTIPQSYGNEGFGLGPRDSASGGEKLTITPPGQDAINYKKLENAFFRALSRVGG